MGNKRITFLIVLLFLIAGAIGFFLIEKEVKNPDSDKISAAAKSVRQKQEVSGLSVEKHGENVKKANLTLDSLYSMPLISIYEIANSHDNIKQVVNEIFELSQGCYYLKRSSDNSKVFFILNTPIANIENRYPRHNMQAVEVYSDGHTEYFMFGYNGQDNEIESAVVSQKGETWDFDETVEPSRPLSHTVYDKRKKILFSESWNYDEANPIKYEMKNASGNVVSVMKETIDGDMGYRQEHILYDDNGNIKKSLTIHYEGADIKWFTYYDSVSPENSVTIESEYENGLKVVEKIYNSEYKLICTIKSQYKDGSRAKLEVYDSEGKNIETLLNQ